MRKTVLVVNEAADWLCDELARSNPGYDYRAAPDHAAALPLAGEAEILLALAPYISAELVAAMPRLEWIHALTTGYDNLLAMTSLAPQVAISNSRGFHGPQMAELAVLSMLALARDFPQMQRNQAAAEWRRWPQSLLLGKTTCIVGLGAIAEALAARLQPFGMRLIGVSDGRDTVAGFDRIFRRDALAAAAAEADFLVVVVPYGTDTHHLIDAQVLAAMKPTAFLVNISRGGCVDEAALIAHLQARRIAGAALDVFESEPLAAGSPLWQLPNVIVTPHVGGFSDIYHQQVLPIVVEHLTAYGEGGAAVLPNRIVRPEPEQK